MSLRQRVEVSWLRGPMVALALVGFSGSALSATEAYQEWEGWIVGKACVTENGIQVSDCPLRHVDDPVLLLEDGEVMAFRYGDGSGVRWADLDGNYGLKVRLTGTRENGMIEPVRFDALEAKADKEFFKGCL